MEAIGKGSCVASQGSQIVIEAAGFGTCIRKHGIGKEPPHHMEHA